MKTRCIIYNANEIESSRFIASIRRRSLLKCLVRLSYALRCLHYLLLFSHYQLSCLSCSRLKLGNGGILTCQISLYRNTRLLLQCYCDHLIYLKTNDKREAVVKIKVICHRDPHGFDTYCELSGIRYSNHTLA